MKKRRLLLLAVALLLVLSFFSTRGRAPAQPAETGGDLVLLDEATPAPAAPSAPEEASAPAAGPEEAEAPPPAAESPESAALDEDGSYDSKEDVALYLVTYGHLPGNYITKKQAEKLGWQGGSVERYAPGKCLGGTYFGNYEGLLPEAKGREYHECDIDTMGRRGRGAKRIIYGTDGSIYYTDDHYESFTQLYEGDN